MSTLMAVITGTLIIVGGVIVNVAIIAGIFLTPIRRWNKNKIIKKFHGNGGVLLSLMHRLIEQIDSNLSSKNSLSVIIQNLNSLKIEKERYVASIKIDQETTNAIIWHLDDPSKVFKLTHRREDNKLEMSLHNKKVSKYIQKSIPSVKKLNKSVAQVAKLLSRKENQLSEILTEVTYVKKPTNKDNLKNLTNLTLDTKVLNLDKDLEQVVIQIINSVYNIIEHGTPNMMDKIESHRMNVLIEKELLELLKRYSGLSEENKKVQKNDVLQTLESIHKFYQNIANRIELHKVSELKQDVEVMNMKYNANMY